MSQRLPGLADEDATGLTKEIFNASTMLLGRTSNLVRLLSAHSPYLARWFLGLTAAVRQPDLGASTDPRLRALASIKTSMTNECTYCSTHTSMYGQALGLTEEELEAVHGDEWRTHPAFSDRDRAAIAWAEALTRNTANADAPLWAEMKRVFSDTEIVEISLASALFNMINRLNDSFWTELEPADYNRRQGNAVSGLGLEQIEAFASRFAVVGEAQRREAADTTRA